MGKMKLVLYVVIWFNPPSHVNGKPELQGLYIPTQFPLIMVKGDTVINWEYRETGMDIKGEGKGVGYGERFKLCKTEVAFTFLINLMKDYKELFKNMNHTLSTHIMVSNTIL